MVFNKIKAKCGKVHLKIFNMANSSSQGRISCTEGWKPWIQVMKNIQFVMSKHKLRLKNNSLNKINKFKWMKNKTEIHHLACNPRLGHLCPTLCCATYSPILFGNVESGVYILEKSIDVYQLGGVVAICNPSGGRKVWSWDCLWGHFGRVEGASLPSPESPAVTGRRIGCRGSCRERQRVRRVTEQRLLSAPGSGETACLNVSRCEQLHSLATHVPPPHFTYLPFVYFFLYVLLSCKLE